MALLDVVLGYDCNLGCTYCTITEEMRVRALPAKAVARELREGRALGLERVSFTGGEPTIRRDLVPLIREARRLGYEDVKVQSNGLLFASKANVDRLVDAGATRLHVSIHSHDEAQYEAIVRRGETYALMVAGITEIARRDDVIAHADVILMRETFRAAPEAIDWLADRGIVRGFLWYVSLTDGNRERIDSLPRIADAIPFMRRAFETAKARDFDLRSLHVPRCLLGEDHIDRAHDPGAERVRVVTPEATFELRDAPLTPGTHVAACKGCSHEAYCPGIRRDYLEVFGDAEIAQARGQRPALAPTRLPVVKT
ncbi:MAG: radical SAM protein [Myxococcota bacterium]